MRTSILTSNDHKNFDKWILDVFAACSSGKLSQEQATAMIGQVVGAIDIGNLGEVRAWIEGRNPITP